MIVKIIFSVFYLACYVVSDATGMIVDPEIYAIVVLFLILFLSPTRWQLRQRRDKGKGADADGGKDMP